VITAEGLTKFYGERPAIEDLSFQIAQGEVVGLLGLNGAGKSTALRILSCLILPTSGKVTIDGEDVVTRGHEIRRRIGYLPDSPPLYPEMTVTGYLSFVARIKGIAAKSVPDRVREVIVSASLEDVRDQVIGTLSHGFRQRVGLAQATVHKPALLILDEPILGLDPVQIVDMRERIKKLRGEHTIIVSSHILTEISQTCDRILVLHEGKLVSQGTEDQLVQGAAEGPYRSQRGHRLYVEVRMAIADAQRIVSGVAGVVACDPRPIDDATVELVVQADRDVREEIARAVVSGGGGLVGLRREVAELESIFVQLTKGGTA
jgi:ABC-2 type transport system ATP-binding protein